MHPLAWLALAIGTEVVATTALKLSDGFTRLGWVAVVVLGYGVSFYALSVALRTIPLGVVYAVWSGVGTATVVVIGYFLFGEVLDALKLGAIAMIVAGVFLLHVGGGAASGPAGGGAA
ncbi:MAG TPA: multidrug efflux SMR transporter, partial [Candidatus Limnocylindria bacterium]|nr:multidrug efflux SMR transporter [Candidatus Limnocylindria bacterium]